MDTLQMVSAKPASTGPSLADERTETRRSIEVPARLIWKDARGTTRIATVRTRDVSDTGVLVECLGGTPIPLHRLVDLHIDRTARDRDDLPSSLRRAQVLAAVYRVGPYRRATGLPESYALRLMVKPDRRRRPHLGAVGAREVQTPLRALTA